MAMVIYKVMGEYRCTTKENYNAPVQDVRRIQNLKDFETAEQIVEYYCKHFGSKPADFEIIQ